MENMCIPDMNHQNLSHTEPSCTEAKTILTESLEREGNVASTL